jgi:hypothetical protein
MTNSVDSMKQQQQQSRQGEEEESRSPPPSPNQTAALPLYYVERPGITHHMASGSVTMPGPNVPLIAIDQLPTWVDVLGIPRELSREQVMNSSMSRVGMAPKGKAYEVYIVPASPLLLLPPPPPTYEDNEKGRSLQMDPNAKPFTSQNGCVLSIRQTKKDQQTKGNVAVAAGTASSAAPGRPVTGIHQRHPSPPAVDALPGNPYPVPYDIAESSYRTQDTARRQRKVSQELHPAERLRQAYDKPSYSSSSSSTTTMTTEGPGKYTTQKYSNSHGNSNNKSKNKIKPKSHTSSSRTLCNNGMLSTYCRHWCLTGKCRWGDACHYRHDMPNTTRELRGLGLEGRYPAWWETHLQLVSKQQTASQQQIRSRADLSSSSDARTMGSIPGLYPYPMNMNLNMSAAAGIQGIPLGHVMTGLPGLYYHPQFHDGTPTSTLAHGQFPHSRSDPLPSNGGKNKNHRQPKLLAKQQQQRGKYEEVLEYKHDGNCEHTDDDDDDTLTAEEEYHNHRASRNTTTTAKKPKPTAAKKRARGNSAPLFTYRSTSPRLGPITSGSPSPNRSPSPGNSTTTSGSRNVGPKQTTTPKPETHGSRWAQEPRPRTKSQARTISSRRNPRHQEQSDSHHRVSTQQQTRRVLRPVDVFEHEIEMALAAAEDEARRKGEDEGAAAEQEKTPMTETSGLSLLLPTGKQQVRENAHHDDWKGHNNKAQGREDEKDEVEKLVDI